VRIHCPGPESYVPDADEVRTYNGRARARCRLCRARVTVKKDGRLVAHYTDNGHLANTGRVVGKIFQNRAMREPPPGTAGMERRVLRRDPAKRIDTTEAMEWAERQEWWPRVIDPQPYNDQRWYFWLLKPI